ncbi:MAG: PASTA domain-containing protein [Desulfuromonadales bacterium]|nr:PASTA domain-containing protein [Desulfuromonadales bacterium]
MLLRIARIAVLIFSGLSFASVAFAGALDRGPMQERYNPTAQQMLRVPGVIGLYEQDALAYLQQAGVAPEVKYVRAEREDLVGKEGTVTNQDPGAGGVSMLGSSVTITVYWPPSMGIEPGETYDTGQYGNDVGQWGEQPMQAVPYEEPEPQWGDSGQNNGDWMPTPQETVTPVRGQRSNGPAPVVATPVEPTATRAEQQPSTPPPVTMTPVQQTVTPVSMTPSGGNSETETAAPAETPIEDGSCRSWYAIAVDITAEAQRIAKELGCAAVQPPAMWQACIKHIDKIGKWNAYNLQLKKRWNRLVKKTSWAAIGPRDLTFGKTHNGRIIGTTGRMFITPVPILDETIKIKLNKKAGKSRTSVTVCSYMPGGDRINEWNFESPGGNDNKGQSWEKDLTGMEGKLLSIHLDGKSVADTFQYSIFLE